MGASNFAGLFDKNPDFFDGEGQLSRDHKTPLSPDLYLMLKELAYQSACFHKVAADGAAGTATAETAFHGFDTYTKSIQKVIYLPSAALTADDTNFATLICRARKKDGTLSSIIAQTATKTSGASGGSGNWTAFVPVVIPLTDGTLALAINNAKLDMLSGWSLTLEITKGGAGVVVPSGILQAFYK